MLSLQEELKKLEQREDEFYKNHPRLSSLDKVIKKSEGLIFFIGIVAVFLGTVLVRWIFYHFPTWNELYIIVLFSYIPGFIIPSFFSDFFCRKYQNYLFRKYSTDRTTYEALIKQRTEFIIQKRDLEVRMKKVRESNLKTNLNDFISDLKRNKFSYSDAKSYQQLLEGEYKAVRKSSFYYHTSRYYTNRLVTIDSLLRNFLVKETKKFVLPVIEPIPNIPIEKHHETNQKEENPKHSLVKEIPITEIKLTSEIKIVPTIKKNSTTDNSYKIKPIPKEQENTSSELFNTFDTGVVKQEIEKTYHPKSPVKIDFIKLNEHRHNIGELGEIYIYEKEQTLINSQGKINQSKKIMHVSLNSDSEGYDIISFTDTGERKFIEVKTTTGNEFEPFYLSNSEMEAMNSLNNYWIYRVYNFNIDLKKGDVYKIDCKKDLDNYYNIQASTFKVTPKK